MLKDILVQKDHINSTQQCDIQACALLRLSQVLKLIPISRTSWYAGVLSGKYPKPIKLTERTAVYRSSDIRALIEQLGV